MVKANQKGLFLSFRDKVDYENLLVLEKVEYLSPEQNVYSFTYFQSNWEGGDNNSGRLDIFKIGEC